MFNTQNQKEKKIIMFGGLQLKMIIVIWYFQYMTVDDCSVVSKFHPRNARIQLVLLLSVN